MGRGYLEREGRKPGFAGSLSSPLFRGTDAVYLKGKFAFPHCAFANKERKKSQRAG